MNISRFFFRAAWKNFFLPASGAASVSHCRNVSFRPPLPRLLALPPSLFFSLEFANPYLAPHSLTTNFVNGFHSGGFSRSSPAPPPSVSPAPPPLPHHSRQAAFRRLSSALFVRLSNCHFLRQIVLSRVGVTDTRIKLGPKKRKRRMKKRRKRASKRSGSKTEWRGSGRDRKESVERRGRDTGLGGCL